MQEYRHSRAQPTRRQFMAAAGATLALSGCSQPPAKWAPVSIYRAAEYSENLYDLIRRLIAEHKLDVRGKRVVLKPNMVEFDERTVINTNPKLVHAALEGFRAAGAVRRPRRAVGGPLQVGGVLGSSRV